MFRLFSQFSPHSVLVSLWGIEQWTGLGVAPSVQQMTLGRPTLKPHLSNLAANYQIYHFLFGGFLRRRRSEAEEKIFCELTSEQTKGQAGSHNKRFLLWHFVNTGKWRKLFGNIICWWFENVEEKYIFKFGSQFQDSSPPPHFTLQFWDKFLASMKLKRILWSIWFSKYHLGSKFNFSIFNIFCLNVCNLPGCQNISCIIFSDISKHH